MFGVSISGAGGGEGDAFCADETLQPTPLAALDNLYDDNELLDLELQTARCVSLGASEVVRSRRRS